ncbi:MAG: phosphate ABC transporter substrate-binding protein PstS [Terriglobales bacterium]
MGAVPTSASRRPRRRSALLALTVAAALVAPSCRRPAPVVNLLETGSSLLYPLFNRWLPAYQRLHPNVRITTQSTGSGTGIAQSVVGIAQIGASDAYLSPGLARLHPDARNIPVAISTQMVNYNLPGLNRRHLRLSGPVLAGIYAGHIRNWDDPALRRLNPGLPLAHHAILPLHRTDSSGDTFIFTQYLTFSTPAWARSVSDGTTVSWPAVAGGLGTEGNPGMITALQDDRYAIGYIGTSYEAAIRHAGLGIAALENRDGNFVLPTAQAARAAAARRAAQTPGDERISLIFAPGPDSYPIINYEYAVVNRRQPSPQMAAALRNFLDWAVSPGGGNAPQFLQPEHFVALPASVARLSRAQIRQIH